MNLYKSETFISLTENVGFVKEFSFSSLFSNFLGSLKHQLNCSVYKLSMMSNKC